MHKLLKSVFLTSLFLFICWTYVFAVDEFTITTYYPSPYGSYDALQADKLGVGNNDGVAGLTAADVPATSGDVWIAHRLGIGTGVAGPGYELDVNGTVKATGYRVGALAGYTKVLLVRRSNAAGGGNCSITVVSGIITASNCF